MSSALTSFRLRVCNCWKGRTFFSVMSQATVSQSNTKLFVPSFTHVGSFARISGYFFDRSSEFREKMFDTPLSLFPAAGAAVAISIAASCATKCICARSPSYLYSQVKSLPSKRSRTSVMDLVGLANIGLRGTPGCNWQLSLRLLNPCSSIAGMMTS